MRGQLKLRIRRIGDLNGKGDSPREREQNEKAKHARTRITKRRYAESAGRLIERASAREARGCRDRTWGHGRLPFGEARRRCLYIDSGVGGTSYATHYESEGEMERKGVKKVLPETGPRGIVEKGKQVCPE